MERSTARDQRVTFRRMGFTPPPDRICAALYLADQQAKGNPDPKPWEDLSDEERAVLRQAASAYEAELPRRS